MNATSRPSRSLALIVAVSRNRVIGKDGALPWHISEDLKHFKQTTLGHAVIMGRKTFESIGKPLPGRRNIVITSRADSFLGAETARTLPEAIDAARKTDECPFIIGGASLFEEALPLTTKLFVTEIDRDFEGDTHFPDIDWSDFEEVETRAGQTEGVTFRVFTRRKP